MASNSDRRSDSSARSKRGKGDKPGRDRRPRERGASRPLSGTGAKAAQEKRTQREARLAQKRSAARRRSVVWLVGLAIILGGCIALYNSALFPVEVVDVTGNERLSDEEIVARAAVPDGATLLRFPGDAVRDRVEEDPWVESAAVSRDFPDTMVIRVEERVPAALVDMGSEYLVVDAEGHIIEQRSLDATTTLTVIRDIEGIDPSPGRRSDSEGLHNALSILAQLSGEFGDMVSAVSVPTIDETALLTNDGVEIFFGLAEDVDKKAAVALEILAEHEGTVVFVDVRAVDRPIWRGLEP